MDYDMTCPEAQRLDAALRFLEKAAQEGKIPGAVRQGRSWMIHTDALAQAKGRSGGERVAMPLMNSAYPVGKSREFIEAIEDEDDRAIAWGEYYYYSGQAELAARTMRLYQDSDDPMLRYSANLVGFFANFSLGDIPQAMQAFAQMQADLQRDLQTETTPLQRATGAFAVTASSVLLHMPMVHEVDMRPLISYLPEGLKQWACYMLAHKAYLEKDYSGSLAVAELTLAIAPQIYPVPTIYLRLVAAMDLMSLKRLDEARAQMAQAWALAQEDDFIEPFGEHHGLLQGMIELFFRKDYPEAFEKIIAITYSFSSGWRKIHGMISEQEVADNLTTTEFTIAMLYNRGWTARQIAEYMDFAPKDINRAIQVIYRKLGISTKRELGKYMLA